MAAAPRRGWSRGGCRAPSRGSLELALAALASTGEGRRGEVSPERARLRAAATKAQAGERGAQRSVRELARCAWRRETEVAPDWKPERGRLRR